MSKAEDNGSRPNRIEIWCDKKTMGLPPILYKNITQSQYFKGLYDKTAYHEVLNEVKDRINTIAPWAGSGGSASGPHASFSLLFKLFTLKLTRKQLQGMLSSTESVYIRALALIYVRMVVQPKDMAYYIKDYQHATDKFDLGGKKVTIGEFIRGIFTDQQYISGLLLPRLPNVPELVDLVGKSNETQRQDVRERTSRRDEHYDRRDYSPPRDRRRRYDDDRDDRDRKRTRYDRSPSPRSRRRSPSPRRHNRRSPSPRREKSPKRQSPVRRDRTPSPPRSPPESRFSKAPVAQTSALLSDYHGKVDKQKLGGGSSDKETIRLGSRRR